MAAAARKLKPSSSPTAPANAFSLSSVFSLSSSSLPSSDQTPPDETLVSAAVSIVTNHRSKVRWSHLRSLLLPHGGLRPSQISQATLLLRNSPHLALRFFLWTARHNPHPCTLLSYATIAHVLARARLRRHALSLLRSALRLADPSSDPPPIFATLVKTYRTCDSAPFVFDLLMVACLESNRIDQALAVARVLRSRSIFPQVSTCNALIKSVSRRRGPHFGYAVYREIFGLDDEREGECSKIRVRVGPNVHTFNELMLGFYQDSVIEKVEEVWEEMGRMNCTPNAYSYAVLMAAYCDEGNMGEAERLWSEMQVKGMRHDVVAYNTIIGGFCREGDVVKAEEFFREMTLGGMKGTSVTYEHLINGYCRIRDVDSAMLLYKDMDGKGFRPEALTIDAIVGELCEKRRVSEAFNIFRTQMRKFDYQPTRKSYKFLIEGLIETGKIGEALKLQEEMVSKGFRPCTEIYNAFINGYVKEGNEELAELLRKEMVEYRHQREQNTNT